MTPKQALEWLDKATAGLTGDRAAHLTTMQALEVLRAAITQPQAQPAQTGS